MAQDAFDTLAALAETEPDRFLPALIEQLTEEGQYHRLFDALLMQKKYELGIPLARPGVIDDVPDEHRAAIEQTYIEAARRVGNLLVEAGKLAEAWVYLRTIREPDSVRTAIENAEVDSEDFEAAEQLINLALYEGAHPVRGLEIMLQTHGTCNTITAMDQQLPNLTDDQRRDAAALLVRRLYQEVRDSVLSHVQQRDADVAVDTPLRELIAGREWLFEGGNYHTDVSHLNAVVRFARAMDDQCPELPLALELAEYGRQLDEPLQYAAEPPFDEFYEGHVRYFRVLLGMNPDQALAWFRKRLADEQDPRDKQMAAYVLVDLLRRVGRLDDAVRFAAEYLSELDDPQGFSFPALCHQAGAWDTLAETAKQRGDLVTWASARLGKE